MDERQSSIGGFLDLEAPISTGGGGYSLSKTSLCYFGFRI